jgi:hypothetical protein
MRSLENVLIIYRSPFQMSQSDYLRRKRIATTLQNDAALYPVLSEQNLLDFKQFSLVNTIPNDKEILNYIVPANKRMIFNIEQTVAECPSFIVCSGTNARPNRIPMTGKLCQILPLNWRKIKENNEVKCVCVLGRSQTSEFHCKCA